MSLRKKIPLAIRGVLAVIYLWVVADRLGILGPVGNPGVVWGDFESFLDYTASLNPWFSRGLSDLLGYVATGVELSLAILFVVGFRLREASFVSFGMLIVFALSMILSLGLTSAFDFIVFTVLSASASFFLFLDSSRKKTIRET